jgi:hypothetical protein
MRSIVIEIPPDRRITISVLEDSKTGRGFNIQEDLTLLAGK